MNKMIKLRKRVLLSLLAALAFLVGAGGLAFSATTNTVTASNIASGVQTAALGAITITESSAGTFVTSAANVQQDFRFRVLQSGVAFSRALANVSLSGGGLALSIFDPFTITIFPEAQTAKGFTIDLTTIGSTKNDTLTLKAGIGTRSSTSGASLIVTPIVDLGSRGLSPGSFIDLLVSSPTQNNVTQETLVVANVVSASTKTTVLGSPSSRTRTTGQGLATIEIAEGSIGALNSAAVIGTTSGDLPLKLTLPSGVTFESVTVTVLGGAGFSADINKDTSKSGIGTNELTIDINGSSVTAPGKLRISGLKANMTNAPLGDLSLQVSGARSTAESVVVAKVVEAGTTTKVASVPTVTQGRTGELAGQITISETTAASLTTGGVIRLELPSGFAFSNIQVLPQTFSKDNIRANVSTGVITNLTTTAGIITRTRPSLQANQFEIEIPDTTLSGTTTDKILITQRINVPSSAIVGSDVNETITNIEQLTGFTAATVTIAKVGAALTGTSITFQGAVVDINPNLLNQDQSINATIRVEELFSQVLEASTTVSGDDTKAIIIELPQGIGLSRDLTTSDVVATNIGASLDADAFQSNKEGNTRIVVSVTSKSTAVAGRIDIRIPGVNLGAIAGPTGQLVSPLSPGANVKVKVQSNGNAGIPASVELVIAKATGVVTVTAAPSAMTLSVGDTRKVSASSTDSLDKFEFTSSDTKVATVDATGIVTAVAPGTATITVKGTNSGTTATVKVTVVSAVPVTTTTAPPGVTTTTTAPPTAPPTAVEVEPGKTITPQEFAGVSGPGFKPAESPNVGQTFSTPKAGEIGIDTTLKKGTQAVNIFVIVDIPGLGKFYLFFKEGKIDASATETAIVKDIVITKDISVSLIGPPDPFGTKALFGPSVSVDTLAKVAKGTWKFIIELKDAKTGAVVSTSTITFTVK